MNVYLNKLDLRLSGNQLEAFIHEYAARLATIPSLTALDLAGCGKKRVYGKGMFKRNINKLIKQFLFTSYFQKSGMLNRPFGRYKPCSGTTFLLF